MKRKLTVILAITFVVAISLWWTYRKTLRLDEEIEKADAAAVAKQLLWLVQQRQRQNQTSKYWNAKKEGRSVFVLHVGPPKTGTSYIQSALASKSEQFRLDNYTYIGNNHGILNYNQVFECATTSAAGKQGADCRLSQAFMTLLQESHAAGMNLIASNEFFQNLSEGEVEALRAALRQDWFLKVVVSYRRLHEIVPSHYNQQSKVKRNTTTGRPIGHHEDWPGTNGDHAIPSFHDFFVQHYLSHDGRHWQARLPTSHTYSIWNDNFLGDHDISIFSIYQPGDMPTNFVCLMIPEADHTCHDMMRHLKDKKDLKDNRSKELDYDILSVAAYQNGWIDRAYNRKEVAKKLALHHQQYLEKKKPKNLLPQKCLKQSMLDTLYEKSLEEERHWNTYDSSSSGMHFNLEQRILSTEQLAAFNASWEKSIQEEKFCSLDVEETLDMSHWEKYITKRFQNRNSR